MIITFVLECILSLLSGYIAYIVTNNIYFLVAVAILFIGYFAFVEFSLKKNYKMKNIKANDLNIFIHDFIASICCNGSIDKAIKEAYANASGYLKEEIDSVSEFKGIKKLESLTRYFSSSFYQLFLKCASSFEKGDSLSSFYYLYSENNRLLKAKETEKKKLIKSFFEFAITWIVAFIILLIARYAISNFIASLSKNFIYLVGIGAFFLFFMFSIHLFITTTNRSKNIYEQN